MSYELFLQQRYSQRELRQVVSALLNIEYSKIGYVYETGSDNEVNIVAVSWNGDFNTRLSVYKNSDLLAELKEIDFAIKAAEYLNENILMTYWDNNPFLWIMVQPDGNIYKVQEVPVDGEKFIHINGFFREQLELKEVRANLIG